MPMEAELIVSVETAVPPETRPMLVGLTEAVRPVVVDREKETVPEKLLRLVRVRMEEPGEPARIVRDEGLEARLKSATLTVMTTAWVSVPLVAVTVRA